MRVLAVASLIALLACSQARGGGKDEAERLSLENQLLRTHAALIAAGDADSLMAASVTFVGPKGTDGGQRLALMARAAAAAPERRDIAWEQLQLCARQADCDVKPIELRLQTLDPGNAAALSGSLVRAAAASDETGVHRTLETMAAGERYDIYWNQTVAAVANAMIRTKMMEPKSALVTAVGFAAAQPLPYRPMADFCRAARGADAVATCRRLCTVLQHGDTLLTEGLGYSVAQRSWPEGSAEYRAAVLGHRTVDYRLEEDLRLIGRTYVGNEFATKRLAALAAHRTEQEVVLADLAAAGVSPDPPASYTGTWHRR
jgi:hypothetical protein